ncbi:Ribokinase-like protein [Gloeopeniophorella convolvens]|nr:Ribokinase-like protein [Gloeopeniophorella convolvens]
MRSAALEDFGRVLSIQSHVAYGYVAGKAATFPLQLLGYDVDIVNTGNSSNQAGYRHHYCTRATAGELTDMFSVLEQNGFLKPARILTGFIFEAEALSSVAGAVTKLLKENPRIVYLLDPVIGDAGRLYVSPEVIPIYRSLLPIATIITPNWFEASLQRAIRILHETYLVPNIVISSIPVANWLRELLPSHIQSALRHEEPSLLCIVSIRSDSAGDRPSAVYAGCVPLIPGHFSGVGDLFSALILGHYTPSDTVESIPPLAQAVSLALTKTHAIISITEQHSSSLPPEEHTATDDELDNEDPERRIRRMRGRELRIVQGRKILTGEAIGELRKVVGWENFWGSD